MDISAVDITSAAAIARAAPSAGPADRAPRAWHWRRSAGVVAAVALLVVAPVRVAAAFAPPGTSAAGQGGSSTAAPPSRFATLSSGRYAWHVASSPTAPRPDDDGSPGPLHGEFPVVAADGTVQTRRWQWGRVVTVADGWFAVASDDGFRVEYSLDAGPDAAAVAVGQQVTVVGVVDGAATGGSPAGSALPAPVSV